MINEPLPVELISLAMAFIILVGGIEPLRVPLSGYGNVHAIAILVVVDMCYCWEIVV